MAIVHKIDIAGNAGGWFDETATSSGWFYREFEDTTPPAPDENIYGIDQSYLDVSVQSEYQNLNTDFGTEEVKPPLANVIEPDVFGHISFPDEIFEADTDWNNWSWSQAPPNDSSELCNYDSGFDVQDFTDFSEYGFSHPPVGPLCEYPIVGSTSSYGASSASSHSVTLPSGIKAGDKLFLLYETSGNPGASPPTGWVYSYSGSSSAAAWRDADGLEGATVSVSLDSAGTINAIVYRIEAGTHHPGHPVEGITTTGLSSSPNPTLFTPSFTGEALFIGAYVCPVAAGLNSFPSNCPIAQTTSDPNAVVAMAAAVSDAGSFDPSTFSLTGLASWRSFTFAIRGLCYQEYPLGTPDGLDDQDFTDTWDYGFSVDPLAGDVIPATPIFLGDGQGLDDQDWTDFSNYGFYVEPLSSDNNPEVAPQALDDQDFTDLADYSFTVDPLSTDNNPEVSPAAIALDQQDFTDFADYGFNQNAPTDLDEQDPDLGLIDCDSQDFTDYTDYSFVVDPPIDDNNPEVAPSALDEQDFTDTADYSFVGPQPIDDFVLVEEFALGLGVGLDDQDFTDTAEYGFSVEPLAGDVENFNLGTGAGLDEQDFTDTSDYGFNLDPPIPDNNPEVAVSAVALDDQDFTDTADYGFTLYPAIPDNNPDVAPSALDDQDFTDTANYGFNVDPPIPDNNPDVGPSALDDQDFTDTADYSFVGPTPIDDNNPEVCVAAIALDTQDFTDTTEYGFAVAPLSDAAPEDFALGLGYGLDEQDFTDREDYGWQTPVLSEDRGEDFPLGTIHTSCDEIVNYFDLSDYSYIVQPNFNDTSVLLPGYTVYVLPSDACQLVVITWNYTTEPSPSWSEITQPSSTWSEVAQPAASWLDINEPSASWTIIIDATEINWNQVC